MNIALKLNIQDHEFEIVANLTNAAGRIYRQQFSRDILKDMNELYKKLNRSPFEGIDMTGIEIQGKSEQEIYEQLLRKVDISKMISAQTEKPELDFEETERAGQIIWAFTKNADKNVPNYEKWIDGFEFVLPVGDIVCALYEAWSKTAQPTIEVKN